MFSVTSSSFLLSLITLHHLFTDTLKVLLRKKITNFLTLKLSVLFCYIVIFCNHYNTIHELKDTFCNKDKPRLFRFSIDERFFHLLILMPKSTDKVFCPVVAFSAKQRFRRSLTDKVCISLNQEC